MAGRAAQVKVRRIVAGFDAGAFRPETLHALAALAAEMQAELLGVFIEDIGLLHLAGLPFAAEVGYPSAARRSLDLAGVERALRAQALALRGALAAALDASGVEWSLRIERGSPAAALAAALADGHAPALLIPPRGKLHGEREVIREAELNEALLRALIAAARPVLILPEA